MTKVLRLSKQLARTSAVDATNTPKYLQIAELLLARVERGDWKPGELMPSESELAELLPASLGTIQKALNNLESRGIVVREQGKGTFVIWARTPERNLRHFRFLREDGRTLLPAYMRMLSLGLVAEQGPWSAFLGSEPDYVHIRRVMNIGGEFDIFSEIFLSGDRFRALAEMDAKELDGTSIRDYLRDRFNAPTLGIVQTFRCENLPPRVCRELGLPHGTFGIAWEMRGTTYREQPISFQRAYVPPADRPLQVLGVFP